MVSTYAASAWINRDVHSTNMVREYAMVKREGLVFVISELEPWQKIRDARHEDRENLITAMLIRGDVQIYNGKKP